MTDLNAEDVRAMGKAVGLEIEEAKLGEVAEVLSAIIEAVDEVNLPGLENVEPLPIIFPREVQ